MSTPSTMTIVVDENIPLAREAFGTIGTVQPVAGRAITTDHVRVADALLVRSVTPVNEALLQEHTLDFVGSATIGTDHIDQDLLQRRGIPFAHAPGSNADSVADYVIAALLHHAAAQGVSLPDRTVGVIGHGNTGSRVARRCAALGCRVLRNDPPLAEAHPGDDHPFVPLPELLHAADIVSLHVPLTKTGAHPTFRLVDADLLAEMQPGTWLVNTARGDVIDPHAVAQALDSNHLGAALFDVWPNEPAPDAELVARTDLATPHIAGYAYDGKVRGTHMLYEALCAARDEPATWTPESALAEQAPERWHCTPPDPNTPRTQYLHTLARQTYAIADDDRRMRALPAHPPETRGKQFAALRRDYPVRREMQRYRVRRTAVPDALHGAVTGGLTMQLRS
ncbi:MAG: 4-phosphoerythronate dehydrogenase [Longimonas sp.]|uniref:4-phosphoerythronate dehydrogenase n=1 Tax=Longimonas sp. TaxID=2039626 RepID=UPI00335BD5BD